MNQAIRSWSSLKEAQERSRQEEKEELSLKGKNKEKESANTSPRKKKLLERRRSEKKLRIEDLKKDKVTFKNTEDKKPRKPNDKKADENGSDEMEVVIPLEESAEDINAAVKKEKPRKKEKSSSKESPKASPRSEIEEKTRRRELQRTFSWKPKGIKEREKEEERNSIDENHRSSSTPKQRPLPSGAKKLAASELAIPEHRSRSWLLDAATGNSDKKRRSSYGRKGLKQNQDNTQRERDDKEKESSEGKNKKDKTGKEDKETRKKHKVTEKPTEKAQKSEQSTTREKKSEKKERNRDKRTEKTGNIRRVVSQSKWPKKDIETK